MLGAGGNDINSGCVYAAVTENIGELGNIFFNPVKYPRKQVAQVMRKDLLRVDIRLFTQSLHLAPYICTAYRLARARCKNHTAFDILLCRVAEKFLFQLFYYKDCSGFRLTINNRLAAFCRFNGYVLQLADANTGCANRLQYKAQPLIVSALRGFAKPHIFSLCQFPFFGVKKSAAEVLET